VFGFVQKYRTIQNFSSQSFRWLLLGDDSSDATVVFDVVLVNERSAKIITAIEHWFDAVLVCVLCTLNHTRLRFKTF